MDKENIPLENIFIITDDLNLLLEQFDQTKRSDGGT
jgi:hypothetical protein